MHHSPRFILAVVAAAGMMKLVEILGPQVVSPQLALSLAQAGGIQVLWVLAWPATSARGTRFGRREAGMSLVPFGVVLAAALGLAP